MFGPKQSRDQYKVINLAKIYGHRDVTDNIRKRQIMCFTALKENLVHRVIKQIFHVIDQKT